VERVTLGELRLAIHREGPSASTPLLCLHGFAGAARELLGVPLAIDRVGVDLIGHGQSDAPADPARYAFARAVDDLRAALDALRVPRADVWGYSQGGRLALALALAHPERVRGLILESASPGLSTEAERSARRADDDALAALIEREGVPAFAARWEALPLFAGERQLPPDVQARTRATRLAQRPHGLAHALRGLGTGAQPSLWPRLGALRVPALLLTGANDAKFTAIAREMAALLPHAQHTPIASAGHAVHRERPHAISEAIASFIWSL